MKEEPELNDTKNLICSVNTASQSSSVTTVVDSDSQTAKDSISQSLQEDQKDLIQPLQQDKCEEDEQDTKCGFRAFHPDWLQIFASKKCYVFVYGLTGMVDLITTTYFNSTISTIEKRFKIQSKMSGFLSSTHDIGVMSAVLFLAYLGSSGNKSRWLASGFLVIGLACFMRLMPHIVYGPGQDALELTEEFMNTHGQAHNNSSVLTETRTILCMAENSEEDVCSSESSSNITILILLASMFIMGAASSMYNTLGISYMDDNAKKNKTPALLAIWQCIRMLGPTLGYLFGSYALTIYVDASLHPTITNKDPRWIGAWWLGWGPLAFINIFLAILLALFPKKLPRVAERMKARGVAVKKSMKSFADFKQVLLRLVKNRILIFNTMSSVFFLFGLSGFWIFMPKYIENQFKQTASMSSFVTGSIGLVCASLGVMASGFVITKFKPHARYLAAWNVFTEAVEALGNFSFIFITCPMDSLQGSMTTDHSWNMTANCNMNCGCGQNIPYSPVCSSDGRKMFYSPCHAGCQDMYIINGTKTYENCSCIGTGGWAVDGPCPVDCSAPLTVFLVVHFIIKFFSASGRAGNSIIQFRCVSQEDKSVSIAFTEVLLCAFAFIPGPVLYGMLLDSACIVWGLKCGQTGNCWLYDTRQMGFLLNITASGFLLGGTLLDVGVWYYAKDLDIYDEPEDF